jgi:glycosyltransferase involved in cell wall biosynthesis
LPTPGTRRGRGGSDRFADLNPSDVSFVILTKNEAANLSRVFESIPAGSPVLVIDAESEDQTQALARARGAEVIVRRWAGFVETRRFALAQVKTPWTFMLDADESLDGELRAAIVETEPGADTAGYVMRRTTFFSGRPIVGCGWGDEAPLRLFRTDSARVVPRPAGGGEADVHEEWRVDGGIARLSGTLLHDSYPSVAAYWAKFDRYTSIEARGYKPGGVRPVLTLLTAVVRLPWLFFVKRGYLDGWRGAVIATGSAFYPVAVLWKAARR